MGRDVRTDLFEDDLFDMVCEAFGDFSSAPRTISLDTPLRHTALQ